MIEAHRFQFIVDFRGHIQRRCVRGVPCNTPGCHRLGDPCWLPDDPENKPSEHYCWAHAYEAGYCRGCGQFWAGIESFDFSRSGLCENCASQGDFDDDDFPECSICGSYLEWEDCWSCGGEGWRDVYEEDPLWYDPGDLERCEVCRGRGGWRMCPLASSPGHDLIEEMA